MNHPWGISGPDFLWLYSGGLLVALGWAMFARWRVRRPRLVEPAPTPDVDGLAFLAGGARRVAETSIARLIDSGALRVARNGKITATTLEASDPVDYAVLGKIGKSPRKVRDAVRRGSTPRAVTALADPLVAQRLLLSPAEANRARRRALIGVYVLLVIGVLRFFNGLAQNLPVGYLALLLALTIVLIVVLHKRNVRSRTVPGDGVLADAKRNGIGLAALVACGGFAAIPDEEIRDVLVTSSVGATAAVSSWTWSGGGASYSYGCGSSGGGAGCGSSSSGGGSSCGGGGGCGGGST